jgi:fatty acid desaturase
MTEQVVGAGREAPPYRILQERIRRAGLLEPRPGFYVEQFAGVVAMTVVAWALVVAVGDSWLQLAVAVAFAFSYGQTALLLHDAGHSQIFRSHRARDWACYVLGNVLLGISAGWWVRHHNRHHNHPNHLAKDPDILYRPIVVSADQDPASGMLRRMVIRNQAWAFGPLFMFDALGFRVLSAIALGRTRMRRLALEIALILVHGVAYGAALASVMSLGRVVAFVAAHHALLGLYLGAMLAPNHKGMPVRDGDELDWVTRQVTTARNIRPNRFVDFLFGGLNYQIEHHLFPTMPRPHLRSARPIVQKYCREHGLRYHELGLVRTYLEVATHLGAVSRSWRRARSSALP